MLKISRRLAGAAILPLLSGTLLADQLQMQNGDVFNGTVLAVNTNAVELKNENLGIVYLSRAKVTAIRFGTVTTANHALAAPVAITSPGLSTSPQVPAAGPDLAAALRGLRYRTNLLQQVQSQVLGSGASPEADAKFNELVDGLSTRKIDMNQLRAQASDAAEQIKELKKQLGPNDNGEMDSYLVILNSFLQETAPGNSSTNLSLMSPSDPETP